MGFVKGMDVSMAKALEAHGASYYLDGKQDDLLQHGAAGQIAGPGILCHGNTLPPRRSEDHSRKNAPSNSGRRRYTYIIIQACVKYKQKTGEFESFPYKKAPPQMQGRHCETEAYFWVFM